MTAYLITGAKIVGGEVADLLIDNGEIVAVGTNLDDARRRRDDRRARA